MHKKFMDEAIKEAEISLSEGGIPIGAVLVKDNEVISRGHNRIIQNNSVILHGEMDAIENAPFTQPFHLVQCVLEQCSYTIFQEWL